MMKKPPFIPTLLTLLGVAILCALGAWQLQRQTWKTALIQELNAEYAKDAAATILSPDMLAEDFLFRRGTLRGTYAWDKQILLAPRVYDKLPGKHVLTPLQLEDGSWIIVNRGWASQHWSPADEKTPHAQGITEITGLLRRPDNNPYAPDNVPEKDQWYAADPAQIAAAKNLHGKIHPYILYREGEATSDDYPVAAATRPELSNNHLQYALFWFTMGAILFVIYFMRFLRKPE